METANASGSSLSAIMQELPELANRDDVLMRMGRYLSTRFLLEIGEAPYHVCIDKGRITSIEAGPFLMRSWTFAIRGREEAWRSFWQSFPPPHFHDVFALAKRGEFRIEGDIYPFMSNLLYFKRLLAIPRCLAGECR